MPSMMISSNGSGNRGSNIPLWPHRTLRPKRPGRLEVRGEVFLPRKSFQQLNREREEEGQPVFANPRNAAAGSLKQLDSTITAKRPLDIVCHGAGAVTGASFASHLEFLAALKDWGLKPRAFNRMCHGMEEVLSYQEEMESRREELPYEIDGVVVKINNTELQ